MSGQFVLGETQRVDLVVRCGRDVRHTFAWSAQGVPFVITNVKAQIRQRTGDQQLIVDLVAGGFMTIVAGVAVLVVPGAVTETWTPTTDAEWEIELTEAGGRRDIPFTGMVRILKGAAR